MSKKFALTAGIAVLIISVSGVAIAKHRGGHCHKKGHHHLKHHGLHGGMHIMKKADADKDGKITKDELLAAQAAKFKEFDLNADGSVTKEEVQEKLSSRFDKMAERITRRFDADRDGKVTADEFKAHAEKKLYILDLNDDGVITKDERPGRHKGWRRHHHSHYDGEKRGSNKDDAQSKSESEKQE